MLLVRNNVSLWSFYLGQLDPQQQLKHVQRVGTLWSCAPTRDQNPARQAGLAARAHGSSSELWVSSLLCSAWKTSPLILSAGFPVGLHLQGSTNPGGKGRKSGWLPRFVAGHRAQPTEILRPAPSCRPRHGAMGRAPLGCTAAASWGRCMGIERQHSLIWREGEYAEASTMPI